MKPTEKDGKLSIGFQLKENGEFIFGELFINEEGFHNYFTPIKEGMKLHKIAKRLQKMGMFETVVKRYE